MLDDSKPLLVAVQRLDCSAVTDCHPFLHQRKVESLPAQLPIQPPKRGLSFLLERRSLACEMCLFDFVDAGSGTQRRDAAKIATRSLSSGQQKESAPGSPPPRLFGAGGAIHPARFGSVAFANRAAFDDRCRQKEISRAGQDSG